MCFIKSSGINAQQASIQEENAVVRHEADASITKNQNTNNSTNKNQNLRTTPMGLQEEAKTERKTLLGD